MGKDKNFIVLGIFIIILACSPIKKKETLGVPQYSPDSKELHDAIARMDSLLFSAYNNCDMEVFNALISEDIEFYHDQSGLTTSKDEVVQAVKENICGKVSRQLLKGSIEVYPVPNYGAVQMGVHRFFNHTEKETGPSFYSKFVHTWHHENGQWKLTRVISLH